MSFVLTMREGLRLYGRNPILIVPPAIWTIVTFTTSSIITSQFAPEGIGGGIVIIRRKGS